MKKRSYLRLRVVSLEEKALGSASMEQQQGPAVVAQANDGTIDALR